MMLPGLLSPPLMVEVLALMVRLPVRLALGSVLSQVPLLRPSLFQQLSKPPVAHQEQPPAS